MDFVEKIWISYRFFKIWKHNCIQTVRNFKFFFNSHPRFRHLNKSWSSGHLMQNQDFGRRKIWLLMRKSRFRGFRAWRFQIFRSRNKIREKMEKPVLDFWKWISWCQIPNSKSKSWFWGVKFWFWMTFSESKFLKNRNFKFWRNSCPISSSNFQNFDELYYF